MDSPLRDKLFVGRQWLFERLCNNLEGQNTESLRRLSTSSTGRKPTYFVVGGPGSGKTAILTEICFTRKSDPEKQCQLRRRVLAYHFCTSRNKKTLALTSFITNLITQISKSPFLLTANSGESVYIDESQLQQDPDEVFRTSFLLKISNRIKDSSRNMYLVVDGLDEAYEQQLKMGESSSGSRTIAELLALHADQLPSWLHILCSSRRNSKGVLKMFTVNKKITIDDYKKDYVIGDFKQYMRALLLDDPQILDEHFLKDFQIVFETLHDKSAGCFLYLELVIQIVAQCIISTREIRNIPGSINGLYSFLFEKFYRSKRNSVSSSTPPSTTYSSDGTDINTIKQILSVLVASQTPMTRFDILDALVTRDCSKPYNPEHLERQIKSLTMFLWKDKGVGFDEQCIQILHHSFTEWITDVKLCGREFVVSAAEGHAMLALSAACFYDLTRITGQDVYDIVCNLSLAHSIITPPLNAELLALWVLWIGLDPERLQQDGVEAKDLLANKILSLATTKLSRQSSPTDSSNHENSFSRLRSDPSLITKVDHHGQTPLMRHLAAGGSNTKLLIDLGSDINLEDMSGASPLTVAVKCGNLEPVKILLEHGAYINYRDYEGWTALRAAAWEGFYDIVCLLLSHKADVDLEDNENRTPLRAAAWRGFVDVAKKLIEYGANVNQADRFGQTPLNAAAYMGNVEIVELLLWSEASINQTDNDGRTALTIACLYEQCEVVKRLLAAGADVNHQDKEKISPLIAAAYKGNEETVDILLNREDLDLELVDNAGRTALLAAASQGHLRVVHALLSRGADCTATDPDGRSVLSVACSQGNLDVIRLLLQNSYDTGSRDHYGWTPMHIAAFEGHVEVCQLLMQSGLSVNDLDDEERSPLICAAQEGHLDVVNFLIMNGARIDHMAVMSGQNALRVAALEGQAQTVEYLLTSGSNIDLRDKDGRTTLYVLAQEAKLEMARLFLEWSASVDLKDHDGRSPLMVAAWQGHVEMCQFLIQHGADVSCVDVESRSVLQMAAWQGHTSIVRLLCESGADINSMCSQGATALTIAAQEGHMDVMECLLEFGADPLIQDAHGRSAYKMAMLGRYPEVKELMERATTFRTSLQLEQETSSVPSNRNSPIGLTQQQRNSFKSRENSPVVVQQRRGSMHSVQRNSFGQKTATAFDPNNFGVPQREPPPPPISLAPSTPTDSLNQADFNRYQKVPPVSRCSDSPVQPQMNYKQMQPQRAIEHQPPCHHKQVSEKVLNNPHAINNVNSNSNNNNINMNTNYNINNNYLPDRNRAWSESHKTNLNSHSQHSHLSMQPQNILPPQSKEPPFFAPDNVGLFHPDNMVVNNNLKQNSLRRNQRIFVDPSSCHVQEKPPAVIGQYHEMAAAPTKAPNAVGAQPSTGLGNNPQYIDLTKLQKSILLQARKQEIEDRERKNKKRKRSLFTKIHNLLKFSNIKSKTEASKGNQSGQLNATSPLSDDEVSVSAFATNPNTPNCDQLNSVNNRFTFGSPRTGSNADYYFQKHRSNQNNNRSSYKSTSSDTPISDKKSADYRRLVDLSHLRTVDPITSRSFRNYDRLASIKSRQFQQAAGNYASVRIPNGANSNMRVETLNVQNSASNQSPVLNTPKKSYYISLADLKRPPSRPPPPVPPKEAQNLFQARVSRPTIPNRLPNQNAHVFEHVNGMSKVVAQNQANVQSTPKSDCVDSCYKSDQNQLNSKDNCDNVSSGLPSFNSSNYIRNYMNQREMMTRYQNRLMNAPKLETIQEPNGGTLEALKAARLDSIPSTEDT